MLLKTIQHDVRSTTGSNMRKIMLLVGNTNVCEVCINDAYKVKYHEIKQEDKLKVPVLNV